MPAPRPHRVPRLGRAMSETRQNRFEIDLDEIERQLRRSADLPPLGEPAAEAVPAPVPARPGAAAPVIGAGFGSDPLADLARIVGQDDPFKGILGTAKAKPAEPDGRDEATVQPAPAPRASVPDLSAEDRRILGAAPVANRAASRSEPRFDPVSEVYGEGSRSIDDDEFRPLPPQRSRGKLFAVVGILLLAVAGTAGAFVWRNGGRGMGSSGPPPLVKADNAPVKVAPQNPGGMDIPDQSKQIYERNQEPARSQVLDRQEQPLDVREAARQLPPAPARSTTAETAPTGPSARIPALPETAATPGASPPGAAVRPAQPNAVISALGEPRRVRTVSVRPDGSAFPADGTRVPSEAAPATIPTTGLPPPVVVPTISVPANPPQVMAAVPAGGGQPVGPAVQVLPPPRPGAAGPSIASLAADNAPVEPEAVAAPDGSEVATGPVVSVQPPRRPAGIGRAGDAAAAGTFAVQIALRDSEADARTAYTELSERFAADLGGLPATVTRADVAGKTAYRVRVTPLPKADADGLCARIKSGGGACFVVAN